MMTVRSKKPSPGGRWISVKMRQHFYRKQKKAKLSSEDTVGIFYGSEGRISDRIKICSFM
jgi:hypothetical protein